MVFSFVVENNSLFSLVSLQVKFLHATQCSLSAQSDVFLPK